MLLSKDYEKYYICNMPNELQKKVVEMLLNYYYTEIKDGTLMEWLQEVWTMKIFDIEELIDIKEIVKELNNK